MATFIRFSTLLGFLFQPQRLIQVLNRIWSCKLLTCHITFLTPKQGPEAQKASLHFSQTGYLSKWQSDPTFDFTWMGFSQSVWGKPKCWSFKKAYIQTWENCSEHSWQGSYSTQLSLGSSLPPPHCVLMAFTELIPLSRKGPAVVVRSTPVKLQRFRVPSVWPTQWSAHCFHLAASSPRRKALKPQWSAPF